MPTQYRVLAVDDDELILQSLAMILPDHWEMVSATDHQKIPEGHFHIAFCDMHMSPDMNKREGLEVIKTLNTRDTHMEIVAMSGDLDRDLMESCLKAGATRFLAKPFAKDELLLTLDKVEALLLLNTATQRSGQTRHPWVGSGPKTHEIKRTVASFRGEPGPILIEGESGTGKDVISRLIHEQEHGNRPYICVNVAAIPETLFESEMFGHVKGAFTGADSNKMGLAEAAHGGDLFIDEIEALPMSQQAKLLRFLESGEIKRVGARDTIHTKCRVIAASNRSLKAMVEAEEFREDLLWRLSGKTLVVPPLRERKEDLKELARHFLDTHRPKHNKTLTADALKAMEEYSWPGNVRELRRVIEQLCLIAPLPIIRNVDVQAVVNITENTTASSSIDSNHDFSQGLSVLIQNYEKAIVEAALKKFDDVDLAAKTLGVSRSTFYKKLKDYNIES